MLETIINENKNLIYAVANYFSNYRCKDDLFQVGCIGLIKAYNNYNSTMNTKFTTYAYPYILGEMKKYIREDKGIKVSRDLNMLSLKIEKVSILLSQKLMREPKDIEIAEYLGIPLKLVSEAKKSNVTIKSIDEKVGDTTLELHEVIGDTEKDINTLLLLKEEIERLSTNEKELIKTRYMDDFTQVETAKTLGMTQVQVSRSEQKILKKLKERIAC